MGRTKITTECDIENQTLWFEKLIDVAATSRPVCYGRAESRSIDAASVRTEDTWDLWTLSDIARSVSFILISDLKVTHREEPNADTGLSILSNEDASPSTSKPRPVRSSRGRCNNTSLVGIGLERTVGAVDQRRRLNRALLCAARFGMKCHLIHGDLVDTFESIDLSSCRPVGSLRPPSLERIDVRACIHNYIMS